MCYWSTLNKFSTNRQSGLFLADVLIEVLKKRFEDVDVGKIKLNNNIKFNSKKWFISKNIFYENDANGLHIYGYPYQINIFERTFSSNCKNGIVLDISEETRSNKKIEEFNKSNNINNYFNLANITLNKCIIEKNF